MRWLLAVFALALFSTTHAAVFTWADEGKLRMKLAMSGSIEDGDTERLLDLIKQNRLRPTSMSLDSGGGSINEALRLAQVVSALYLRISVRNEKMCASACFLVFMAGAGRAASPAEMMTAESRKKWKDIQAGLQGTYSLPGFVGLHRPYQANISSVENDQLEIMRRLSRHLEAQMLSRRLIDLMMSRPSNDIYWLKRDDLQELGDYSPHLEELFIKKCGYDRNSLQKQLDRPKDAARLLKQSDKAVECIADLTAEGADAGWRKLKTGWIPPKQVL